MKRDDFTEKWVEHFNTVNKDCILSLPFNPNHIGKLDQLSVLSYVQAANKHARLWRWPLLAIAKTL